MMWWCDEWLISEIALWKNRRQIFDWLGIKLKFELKSFTMGSLNMKDI